MPYAKKEDQAAAAKAHYEKHKDVYKARAKAWNTAQSDKLRAIVDELKAKGCTDCGNVFHPEAMDFDHISGTKKHNMSTLACRGRCSFATFQAELAKCEVVCANCHRVRTFNRRQNQSTRVGAVR